MEIIVRSTIIFFFLWMLTRAMGKRELAEMTAFELLLLVTFGDIVQQGITQEDMSITGAMLAVGTIGLWILLFSYSGFRWRRARRLVDGIPVVVVRDGEPQEKVMRMERIALDDVLEGARTQGISNLRDVRLAILEPDGRLSFIRKTDGQGVQPEEHRSI